MSTTLIMFGGLAAVFVGTAGLQLIHAIYESVRRSRFNRQAEQMSLALLAQRVEAATAARKRRESAAPAWNGFRKFVVDQKEYEAENIYSFYFIAHDRKPLANFMPGQFLTLQLKIPGVEKPVVRCYSLSDCSRPDYYRISVKRCLPPPREKEAPPGVVSSYLHDFVEKGDIIDIKAPSGQFYLETHKQKPAVLIGGGIGITPMLSMANAVIESNSTREIWMFYGVRNLREPIHNGYLRELSHKHDHFNYVVCCSNPDPDDLQGRDFDHHGRIDTDLLKQHLKTNNYDFFICGPPPLMSALTQALAAWGVPKSDIRTEAFGPASVPKPKKKEATKAVATANAIKVEFTRSKKSANWDSTSNNLLDFGEDNGALMQGGCRVGNCGTCEVAVLSGEVEYNCDPEYSDLGEGCCLACISTPKGNVVLDA